MKKVALMTALCLAVSTTAEPGVCAESTRQRPEQRGEPETRPRAGRQRGERGDKPARRKQAEGARKKTSEPRPVQGARKKKPRQRTRGEGARGTADSAGPQRGPAQPLGRSTPAQGSDVRQGNPVDQALAALERKALSGQARPSDFQNVNRQLAAFTAREGDRGRVAVQRLRRTVDDLEQRARTASLDSVDLALLREQAEVDRLAQRAASTRITPQDLGDLRLALAGERLSRALDDLERRSLAKRASAADVQRVNDRIEDEAQGPRVDPKLHEKLRQAIARLEGRLLRGEVTPEEFAELRSALTRRARNAADK